MSFIGKNSQKVFTLYFTLSLQFTTRCVCVCVCTLVHVYVFNKKPLLKLLMSLAPVGSASKWLINPNTVQRKKINSANTYSTFTKKKKVSVVKRCSNFQHTLSTKMRMCVAHVLCLQKSLLVFLPNSLTKLPELAPLEPFMLAGQGTIGCVILN